MVSKRSCDAPRWWDQGKPVGIFPEQNRQDTRAGVARLGGTWGGHALAEGPWALGVGCLQNGTSPSVSPLA